MENQDYTIAEEFILPSLGKIYPKTFDPYIKLRSMTVRDELKRTNPQSITVHKNLCEIIDNCLLTPLPYKCYDLCIGDYEYLLHKLRVVTYGPDYKIIVGCPHCNSVHEEVINLDDLKVKEFDLKKYEELLSFVLPVSKKEVTLKIQTPRILDAIEIKVKEFKKKNPEATIDPRTLIKLQEMIDTVDGNKLSYIELENFINYLPARDANMILNRIEKINQMIGLDTALDVTCKQCGGDIKTFFRFGTEFFRPTIDE